MNKLLAYGTLRPRNPDGSIKEATHYIMGYKLYDVGPFPYIAKADPEDLVFGNVLDADDAQMSGYDRYEGCSSGFYIRDKTTIFSTKLDDAPITGFVYVGGSVAKSNSKEIVNGDWAKRNES